MKRQLALLEDTPTVWRLDEHTREVGRQGVARARELLRQAHPPAAPADNDNDDTGGTPPHPHRSAA